MSIDMYPPKKRGYGEKISVEEANQAWLNRKPKKTSSLDHPWKKGLTCMPRQIDRII